MTATTTRPPFAYYGGKTRIAERIIGMQSTSRPEPMRGPHYRTATRFATNHNWNRRGDNTKPKHKK